MQRYHMQHHRHGIATCTAAAAATAMASSSSVTFPCRADALRCCSHHALRSHRALPPIVKALECRGDVVRRWRCSSATALSCGASLRLQSSGAFSSGESIDATAAELLEVSELLLPEDEDTTANPSEGGSAGEQGQGRHSFEVITTLDMFARAKMLNFLQRHAAGGGAASDGTVTAPPSSSSQSALFVTQRVHTFDGSFEYICRLRLASCLDAAMYGERYGEGCADNEKDAEVVAAMHAERVVDAFGLPMFQLASKQKRHAEAARKAGRWAVIPGEPDAARPPVSPLMPSPRSLRLRQNHSGASSKAVNEQFQDDERRYALVTASTSITPLPLTLASRASLDSGSVGRVRQYIESHPHLTLLRSMRCVPLHTVHKREATKALLKHTTDVKRVLSRVGGASPAAGQRRSATGSWSNSASSSQSADTEGGSGGDVGESTRGASIAENWLVQIRLPVPDAFGSRVASGRGPDKKTAIACACMHAELIIDALGVAMYPADPHLQRQHAEECAMVGRWATDRVDDSLAKPHETSPAPLRFATSSPRLSAASTTTVVDAASSDLSNVEGHHHDSSGPFERVLAQHTAALKAMEHVIRLPTLDHAAVKDVRQYLARYLAASPAAEDDGDTHKDDRGVKSHNRDADDDEGAGGGIWVQRVSSLFLTQTLGLKGRESYRTTLSVPLSDPIEIWYDVPPLRRTKQELVAIGVGPTQQASETACAMHALQLLGTLGVPLYTNDGDQQAFAARVRHLGGIAAPSVMTAKPLAGQTKDVKWSRNVERCMMKYIGTTATAEMSSVGRVICPGNAATNEVLNISAEDVQHHIRSRGDAASTQSTSKQCNVRESTATSTAAQDYLHEKMLVGQSQNPRSVWSLIADYPPPADEAASCAPQSGGRPAQATDASACILLHPTASSLRYCHSFRIALGSVRILDSSALERAQDYFERHGMDLQQRWVITQSDAHHSSTVGAASGTAASALAADRHLHGGGGAQEDLVVAQLHVPVPPDAGPRVAIGKATSREEAQILCAMHLEVLLDEIGVPLFDYTPLQRRHAEAAASFGRRAAFDSTSVVRAWTTAPSPPPLVKPWESSTLWLRWLRFVVGAAADVGKNDAAEYYHWHPHCSSAGGAAAADATRGGGASSFDNADAALVAGMVAVSEASIVLPLKNYLAQYYERHSATGLDNLEVDMRISQRSGPTGHPFFHATLPISLLPIEYRAKFGAGLPRVAHACASTRRNAFFLCTMHAVHVLDVMGIPVMGSWGKQPMHVDYQKSRGWWAPRSQEESDAVPADVATPPGFKCLELGADLSLVSVTGSAATAKFVAAGGRNTSARSKDHLHEEQSEPQQDGTPSATASAVMSIPIAPETFPAAEHNVSSILWTGYVKQCRAYISSQQEALWYNAAMIEKKAPRSGDPLADEGLDAVEGLRLDPQAKGELVTLCQSLHYPPPERYDVVTYGRHPHKAVVVTQVVQGTPYTAIGTGPDTFGAVGRASMHYSWILHRVSTAHSRRTMASPASPLSSWSHNGSGLSGRGPPLVQSVEVHDGGRPLRRNSPTAAAALGGASGSITDEELQSVVHMLKVYTATHPPGRPVSYQFRERSHPSGSTIHVCSAEVMDETGLRVTAKAECTMDSGSAKKKALVELHRMLLAKAGMQSVTHLCRQQQLRQRQQQDAAPKSTSSSTELMFLTSIALPPLALRERMEALLQAPPPPQPLPLQGVRQSSTTTAAALKLSPMLEWFLKTTPSADVNRESSAKLHARWSALCTCLGLMAGPAPLSSPSPPAKVLTPLGETVSMMLNRFVVVVAERSSSTLTTSLSFDSKDTKKRIVAAWSQLTDSVQRVEGFAELLIRCCVFLAVARQVHHREVGQGERVLDGATAIASKLLSPAPDTATTDKGCNGSNDVELLTWLRTKAATLTRESDGGEPVEYGLVLRVLQTVVMAMDEGRGVSSTRGPPPQRISSTEEEVTRLLQFSFLCAFGPASDGSASRLVSDAQLGTTATDGAHDGDLLVSWRPQTSAASQERTVRVNGAVLAKLDITPAAPGGSLSTKSPPSTPSPHKVFLCATADCVRDDTEASAVMAVDSPWWLWFSAGLRSSSGVADGHPPATTTTALAIEGSMEVPNLWSLWGGTGLFCVSMELPKSPAGAANAVLPTLGVKTNASGAARHAMMSSTPPPTAAAGAAHLQQLARLAERLRLGVVLYDGTTTADAHLGSAMSVVLELMATCRQAVMSDDVRHCVSLTGRPQHSIGVLDPILTSNKGPH